MIQISSKRTFRDKRTEFVFQSLLNLVSNRYETTYICGKNGEQKWIKYFSDRKLWGACDHPDEGVADPINFVGYAGVPLYVRWDGAVSAAVKELGGFDQIDSVYADGTDRYVEFD